MILEENSSERISIAMATYNGAKFIGQQLDSLAKQSVLPCELVITDDGSTDETIQIIEQFSQKSPFPVKIYSNTEKLGYRDNFIKAAYLCEGDFIAFCDQDDVWHSDKLALQKLAFSDPKVMLVAHPYREMDVDGVLKTKVFPNIKAIKVYNSSDISPFFTYYGMTLMFRRHILPRQSCVQKRPVDHSTFKHLMSHDQWIPLLAFLNGSVLFLPDPLTMYRIHGSNTCGPVPAHGITTRVKNAMDRRSTISFSEHLTKLSEALASSIMYAQSYCTEGSEGRAKNADSTIRHYGYLVGIYKLRADVYNYSYTRIKRASCFLQLCIKCAYSMRARRVFTIGGAIKDLVAILLVEKR
jgi:glycosyltransferase involved in cell wall biosynthesis